MPIPVLRGRNEKSFFRALAPLAPSLLQQTACLVESFAHCFLHSYLLTNKEFRPDTLMLSSANALAIVKATVGAEHTKQLLQTLVLAVCVRVCIPPPLCVHVCVPPPAYVYFSSSVCVFPLLRVCMCASPLLCVWEGEAYSPSFPA